MAVSYDSAKDAINRAINELRRVMNDIEREEIAGTQAETAAGFATTAAPGTGSPALTNAEANIKPDPGTSGASGATGERAPADASATTSTAPTGSKTGPTGGKSG